MMNTPKFAMACGHVSNGLKEGDDGTFAVCISCHQNPETRVASRTTVSLANRKAECKMGCGNQRWSSVELTYFEYRADKETDLYYDGCQGW